MNNDNSPWERGAHFEEYVSGLYRGLGYAIEHNTRTGGQQNDIIAEKNVPGLGMARLVIECKFLSHGNVKNQDVLEFIARVRGTSDSKLTKGVMVTNADFTADAKEAARNVPRVLLRTTKQLEDDLFNLSDAFVHWTSEYETSQIFSQFVPPSATARLHDPSLNRGSTVSDALNYVRSLISEHRGGLIWILGDFGSGKTTLLHQLKYHCASAYVHNGEQPAPCLFELKEHYTLGSIEALVRSTLARECKRDISLPLFWNAVANARLLLLFDGFDEMVSHSDASRRRALLAELSPLLSGPAPTIITCRTAYFVSHEEFKNTLAKFKSRELPMDNPLARPS